MKYFSLFLMFSIILSSCGLSSETLIAQPSVVTDTNLDKQTSIGEQLVPTQAGNTILVNNAADEGTGTFRWALEEAKTGDTISFDPVAFPPDKPTKILLKPWVDYASLPNISQGRLTIDASNAGVILDGSNLKGDWVNGLEIYSDGNVIQGLQIVNFSGAGIICTGSRNIIGGDRKIGTGQLGQGNLISNNGKGIDLCGTGSFNTITGNLIGTDPSGLDQLGNHSSGIDIHESAQQNMIGPDNIIAYNDGQGDGYGIEIHGHTPGNTITQNSIHDNDGNGINLSLKIDKRVSPPFIMDFNMSTGTITGITCASCMVEVYSDRENEGMIYEGRTISNDVGDFSINKGTPFAGPHLTTTATDSDGNTSQFSMATPSTQEIMGIQKGNKLPRTKLLTKEPRDLEDNRIGVDIAGWELTQEDSNSQVQVFSGILYNVRDLGIKWVRTGFWMHNPLIWQDVLQSPGVYKVPKDADDFISALYENGINIVLTLSAGAGLDGPEYGPNCEGESGLGALGDREPEWWFNTQAERDKFADYARFMVEHFKGRVKYYEIWNEPSSGENSGDCRGGVTVKDYVSLVTQVTPIIRQIDPEAKVVMGAIGRLGKSERQWMLQMLDSDVAALVDAISWHPFYGESPRLDTSEYSERFYWRDYPSNTQTFKAQTESLGFKGQYMVEEMVWRTLRDLNPNEAPIYTDLVVTKYAARAIITHLDMDFAMVSSQGLMPGEIIVLPRYNMIRNLSTIMAGAKSTSLPVEIQSKSTNIKSYSFSLPNGDLLIALWTDGEAIDEDPGVNSTLTIQGFSSSKVKGIDILYGFEQPMITGVVDENLVVNNLLVKDYPTLVLLTK